MLLLPSYEASSLSITLTPLFLGPNYAAVPIDELVFVLLPLGISCSILAPRMRQGPHLREHRQSHYTRLQQITKLSYARNENNICVYGRHTQYTPMPGGEGA